MVKFALRQQGLMVMRGNPKGVSGIDALIRPDITFVNRQRGSGTRMLLDYHLLNLGITADKIGGYEKEVGTHMAVAASVAAGASDTGLGVMAAANALGLDFIPVAEEQYDLIFNFAADDYRQGLIIDVLHSADFRKEVESLGGYDLCKAGQIFTVKTVSEE